MALEDLITTTITPAFFSSIAQIVVGLVASKMKTFNIDKEAFKKKCAENKEKLIEKLSVRLADMLDKHKNFDIPIRGEKPKYDDLVAAYHTSIMDYTFLYYGTTMKFKFFKRLHNVLFYLSVIGILILLVSLFAPEIQVYLLLLSIVSVIIQICCIVLMFQLNESLDNL